MKNICFIPLRAGSKGIINKNVNLFNGKPLFTWVLNTLINSNIADEIWLGTDCELVKEIAKKEYPQVFLYNRSAKSALDSAGSIEVVLDFLNEKAFAKDDNFVLIQATSPLMPIESLLKLAEIMKKNVFSSIVACAYIKIFRWSADGQSLDYTLDYKPQRQEFSGVLAETGAFYMSKVGNIMTNKQLLSGNVGIIEQDNKTIIDIDYPIDIALGEVYASYIDGLRSKTKS